MSPPNLWEEVSRYGAGGLIVYCSKLAEFLGTNNLFARAFANPLDVGVMNALLNDRAIYVNQRCALMVQTIDNVVSMMRAAMQRARPLGKRPSSTPTRVSPVALDMLLSQARTAALRGQVNVANAIYMQYLDRMRFERPGVRPQALLPFRTRTP